MMAALSNKTKRKTEFDDSYTERKYNFVIKCSSSVPDNSFKFWCTIWTVDLSYAHGGSNDVDHHIKTGKIKQYEKNLQRKTFQYLIMHL